MGQRVNMLTGVPASEIPSQDSLLFILDFVDVSGLICTSAVNKLNKVLYAC